MDRRISDLVARMDEMTGQLDAQAGRIVALESGRGRLLAMVGQLAQALQTTTDALDESDDGIRTTINETLGQLGLVIQTQRELSQAIARLDDDACQAAAANHTLSQALASQWSILQTQIEALRRKNWNVDVIVPPSAN